MTGKRRLTGRGYHARRNRVAENSSEVVHKPPDDYSLVPQSSRRCLCHNGITSRSYRDHIAQRRNDQQDSNSHLTVLPVGPAETAYRYEAEEHERHATHVDGCSTEVREQKPANNAADNVTCRKGNVYVKRLEFSKSCGFKKHNRVAENGIATKDLGGPDDAILNRGSTSQLDISTGYNERILTISVRRRLVPWKHSKKLAFAVSALSRAVVCLM